MKRIDFTVGVVMAGFSLLFIIFIIPRETSSFGDYTELSPAFFPYLVSIALFALSCLLVLKGAVKQRDPTSYRLFSQGGLLKILWGTLILFASVAGLHVLGFLITGILTVSATMVLMGCRKWSLLIAVPLSTTLALYLAFYQLLHRPLPAGLFFS